MKYPETKKAAVSDCINGITVYDPYRWLESETAEVVSWDEKQNALTEKYLSSWQDYSTLEDIIRRYLETPDSPGEVENGYSLHLPQFFGNYMYQVQDRIGKRQPALYYRKSYCQEWKLLIDPDKLERGSTLDWYYPSPDGSHVAFGLSKGGDEQSVLYLVETESGKILSELILYTSFCRLAWLPDSSGFYHSAGLANDFINAKKYLFFHRLGCHYSEQEGIDFNDIFISPVLSEDGRYLVVNVNWEMPKASWYKDRYGDNVWKPFLNDLEGESFGEFYKDRYLVLTTDNASRGRIVSVPIENASDRGNWQEIVSESTSVLQHFKVVGRYLVISELYSAHSRLRIINLDKGSEKIIKLPGMGLIQYSGAKDTSPFAVDGSKVYFIFETFTESARLYCYDLESAELKAISPPPTIDLSHLKVSQRYYPSKDGVKIPIYLVHRRDLDLTVPQNLLLSGYGGWNFIPAPCYVARTRNFVLPFLEAGGICAYPGIRGGCEFGREWWFNGRRKQKQTTFDDFYAAAEYLIGKGITEASKIAIFGASNGGLLVAVALTQRPDLFAAGVAEVPLADMVRTMKDPYMQSYIAEYGDPNDPEMLSCLLSYSPAHNVVEGTAYPGALFLSGYRDVRCQVWNSRKMVALLQEATISGKPVLFRALSGGHGPGLSIDELVERKKVILAFIMNMLKMKTR